MSVGISKGRIFVPHQLRLEGPVDLPTSGNWQDVEGRLSWAHPAFSGEDDDQSRWARCTDATLSQFVRIASPEDILHFAKRFGVLGAKRVDADLPVKLPNELNITGERWSIGAERRAGRDEEPLTIWFLLVQQFRAALRINIALKGRTHNPAPTVGTPADWAALAGDDGNVGRMQVEDAQFFLLLFVNRCLREGNVSLQLQITEWSKKSTNWQVEVSCGPSGGYNLYGHLAYQLFLSIVGEDRLYACSACGNPYVRHKKAPRKGQENFCDECAHVAKARATQRYRSKKSSEGAK